MKNLAKTIDRILKIEPELGNQLLPIRKKFSRFPSKERAYWEELLGILNSETMLHHPKREEIRKVVSFVSPRHKLSYTFKQVGPQDKILGALPEHLSDRLKSHDRRRIEMAKHGVEAEMTGNESAFSKLMRTQAMLEIDQAKIWVAIKDHFDLWKLREANLHIKKNGEVLVVTMDKTPEDGGGSSTFLMQTPMGTMKMDREALIQFFKSMGMKPPPGMIPDSEGDDD